MDKLILEDGDTLYLKLYNLLKKDIESEKLTYKLPSIRKLAKKFKVSNFTVIKAYELLEKNAYVFSKKGSGFYIKYNRNNHFFYPEDYMVNEEFKYNYFTDNCSIDFSSASPKNNFFPIDILKSTINSILDTQGEKALLYELPQGNIEFRKCILKTLKTMDIETKLENIQIISGAQQGINLISQVLIQNNDIVIVEDPTYKGAINSFKEKGAVIERIPLDKDGINIELLENFLKYNQIRLLYIIPIFQNPTGITLSQEKKYKLLNLAEKYNFYIIEDDSSSELYFKDKIFPLKSLDNKDRVIFIKSYSKIFMPGFRIGFMIVPPSIVSEVIRTKYSTDISTSGLNQRIFQYFLENNIWMDYIFKLRKEYSIKQELLYNELSTITEISFNKPQGGLSFWIKLPPDITGEAVYFKLIKEGVRIIPGVVFSINYSNYLRLSFAQCNSNQIKKGIKLFKKVLSELININ
ncbi:PLP-dependent aminotransferase family protein [Fusobacterium sp.]|uniref:MocR-like pyridoxine biosynthesis transcription factor PdxR n=1 Tax=Fusobacterium sp. TaxID=68766 RepID=UPI0025BF8ED0|nr:PLP-dependent aminotransferase family protein [Fusobacterium sp.]